MSKPRKKDTTNWLIIGLLAFLAFMLLKQIPVLNNLSSQASTIGNVVSPFQNLSSLLGNFLGGLLNKNSGSGLQNAPNSLFNSVNSVAPNNILSTYRENGSSSFLS